MGILSDLYKGELNPSEKIISHNPEYRLLTREVEKGWEKFADYLNGKDKEQFQEWRETVTQYEIQDAYENFAYGFRMGGGTAHVRCVPWGICRGRRGL